MLSKVDFKTDLDTCHSQTFFQRDHIAVCSKPKIEWLLADMSILVSNFVAVQMHHVISDDDLQFIANHAEVTAVFCSAELIPRVRATLFMNVA